MHIVAFKKTFVALVPLTEYQAATKSYLFDLDLA